MNLGTHNRVSDQSLPAELTAMGRGSMAFSRMRMAKNLEKVQSYGGVGDVDWQAIAQMTKDAAQVAIPILVAQNPGTLYRYDEGTGQVMVYAQPTGSTQNLPVGAGGFPVATVNTPLGSGSVSAPGLDMNTLLLVGAVGLVAVLLMTGRGR